MWESNWPPKPNNWLCHSADPSADKQRNRRRFKLKESLHLVAVQNTSKQQMKGGAENANKTETLRT